jgi:Protein of unknown function (DUF1566)
MRIRHLAAPFLLALASTAFAAPFEISADGQEVTDSATSLVWRRCAEGMQWNGNECAGDAKMLWWNDAVAHAKAQAKGGKAWRLPTLPELSGIVDKTQPPPMIDPKAFPNAPAMHYWSSQVGKASHEAHYVYFITGTTDFDRKDTPFFVRLVRNK